MLNHRGLVPTLRPVPTPLLTAVAALALSGCAANPLVSWERPSGVSGLSSPVSLKEAQAYADKARDAYAAARFNHVQATTRLNSGLLGLGVLGTGFALAKAHRDALLGAAALGGTAYAFGQQNLNVQHRLIYEAGIDAIGCVKEAVLPSAMSDEDRKSLVTAMTALEEATGTASSARADVISALLAWNATNPASPDLGSAANSAISATGVAVESATTSVTSGRIAIRRAGEAGYRLILAVDRVDAAVNKNLTATLPDPTSVFKVIGGLPGFAAGIVPGSDAAFNAALARSRTALLAASAASGQGTPVTQGGTADPETVRPPLLPREQHVLLSALKALNATNDKLKLALAKVNGYLPSDDALRGFQALKECGLGELNFALKANPAAPSISAGENRKTSFTISGGTAPYGAQLQVSPVKGVNLITPLPFDTTVIFEITKEAEAGSVPVVVMDASKPQRTVTVLVEILPAAKAPGTTTTGISSSNTQSGSVTDPAGLVEKINAKVTFRVRDDMELRVLTPAVFKPDLNKVDLSLSCKPKPASCFSPEAAKLAVLAGVGAAASLASTLNVAPTAGCVCAK